MQWDFFYIDISIKHSKSIIIVRAFPQKIISRTKRQCGTALASHPDTSGYKKSSVELFIKA